MKIDAPSFDLEGTLVSAGPDTVAGRTANSEKGERL